jgi:hypothetical protein
MNLLIALGERIPGQAQSPWPDNANCLTKRSTLSAAAPGGLTTTWADSNHGHRRPLHGLLSWANAVVSAGSTRQAALVSHPSTFREHYNVHSLGCGFSRASTGNRSSVSYSQPASPDFGSFASGGAASHGGNCSSGRRDVLLMPHHWARYVSEMRHMWMCVGSPGAAAQSQPTQPAACLRHALILISSASPAELPIPGLSTRTGWR